MRFSEPIWLWALGGLLVPLAIHLLSRREGKVIPIGSLRYLRASATAKFKHVRLNEVALLLLRCLLLILIVLLVAGASSDWFQPQKEKWVVLEDGVETSPGIAEVIQRLQAQGFETRAMANGFPPASRNTLAEPIDSYWTAVRQLTARSLDSVVVIAFNYQRRFKGHRLPRPRNLTWLTAEAEEKEFVAHRFVWRDSVWMRHGRTSPLFTRYETKKTSPVSAADSPSPPANDEVRVSVFSGDGFGYDEKILLAALKAIQSVTQQRIAIATRKLTEEIDSADVVFWLADHPAPAGAEHPTITFARCPGEAMPLLISAVAASHDCDDIGSATWVLTKRLNEEIALKENLALRLAEVILPAKELEYDQRVLPESMMWASADNKEPVATDARQKNNLDFLLIILILITMVVERAVAYKRKQ